MRMESGASAGRTVVLSILLFVSGSGPLHAQDAGPPKPVLTAVNRVITQHQGAWIVDYRLRKRRYAGGRSSR